MAKHQKVKMPNLIGLDPERAAFKLEALSLIAQCERRGLGNVPFGRVSTRFAKIIIGVFGLVKKPFFGGK